MTFAQKLVFLMQLTSTSNKQLALAVKVDPSLISLLRRARRKAPKKPAYLRAMAAYFAKKCDGVYQRIALTEAIGLSPLTDDADAEALSGRIYDWLTEPGERVGTPASMPERARLAEPRRTACVAPPAEERAEVNAVYYGNDGKRAAILAFLELLLSLDAPDTVLLASDESSEFLRESPAFLARVRELALTLLTRGFRLRRIATPLYTTEQAFDSLDELLPAYLTGQVESFYYPCLRDGVHRRTLLVLPGTAAVVSSSIGEARVSRASVFSRDAKYIRTLTQEFDDHLALCRPSTTAYSTAENPDGLLRCLAQFERDCGNRIQQSTTLSFITTPPPVLRLAMADAPAGDAQSIVGVLTGAQTLFEQSLSQFETVDIHSLASPRDVREGRVPISVSYLLPAPPARYTPETYALHLESILRHMEQFKRYRAVLRAPEGQTRALMVKDGRQALLLRPDAPLTVFEVSQPHLAEACRAHLLRLVASPLPPAVERQNTMERLRATIRELRHG